MKLASDGVLLRRSMPSCHPPHTLRTGGPRTQVVVGVAPLVYRPVIDGDRKQNSAKPQVRGENRAKLPSFIMHLYTSFACERYSVGRRMMKCWQLTALVVVLGWVLWSTPASTTAQPSASLTGIVTYRERVLLPADALVVLQIAEVTPAGTGGRVIVEQTFATGGAQPPFRFNLRYDPSVIDAGRVYTLQGRILSGGRTLFTTANLIPVITGNAPRSDIQVVMGAVRGATLPPAGSELWLVGVALILGGIGSAIHMIRSIWRMRGVTYR